LRTEKSHEKIGAGSHTTRTDLKIFLKKKYGSNFLEKYAKYCLTSVATKRMLA